eukprot:365058-Chlamydomonas_euryale.AAC.5
MCHGTWWSGVQVWIKNHTSSKKTYGNLGGGAEACPPQLLVDGGIFCHRNEDAALVNELPMWKFGDGLAVPAPHIHKSRYTHRYTHRTT